MARRVVRQTTKRPLLQGSLLVVSMLHMVVVRGQLENPSPALDRALAAYRRLDLTAGAVCPVEPPSARRPVRLTAAVLDRAVADYEAGATLKQIGAQLGVSRHTLSARFKTRGVQLRFRRLSNAENAEAVRLYGRGVSLALVGERRGRDASLIRNQIAALASGAFLTEARNVVLLGPLCTGKTHLATALGVAAARHSHRVLFATATYVLALRGASYRRRGRGIDSPPGMRTTNETLS